MIFQLKHNNQPPFPYVLRKKYQYIVLIGSHMERGSFQDPGSG
jgi:hypothetical protein